MQVLRNDPALNRWDSDYEGAEHGRELSREDAVSVANDLAAMWPTCSWGIAEDDIRASRWGISPRDVETIHEAVEDTEAE